MHKYLYMQNTMKKSSKKFASSKIVTTFAVPFETNGIFYGLRATFIDNTERID